MFSAALEEIRAASGAVADVVADEIRDHRRIARVVFGDAGFHLADQVGADVGRLGVDAAAELGEERHEGGAEAVADDEEGDSGRLDGAGEVDEGVQPGNAEQAHGHDEQAGHRSASQGDPEGAV
jgi:hypothetical protein